MQTDIDIIYLVFPYRTSKFQCHTVTPSLKCVKSLKLTFCVQRKKQVQRIFCLWDATTNSYTSCFMLVSGYLCWSIAAAYRNGEDAVLLCHLKNWLICAFPDSHMSLDGNWFPTSTVIFRVTNLIYVCKLQDQFAHCLSYTTPLYFGHSHSHRLMILCIKSREVTEYHLLNAIILTQHAFGIWDSR